MATNWHSCFRCWHDLNCHFLVRPRGSTRTCSSLMVLLSHFENSRADQAKWSEVAGGCVITAPEPVPQLHYTATNFIPYLLPVLYLGRLHLPCNYPLRLHLSELMWSELLFFFFTCSFHCFLVVNMLNRTYSVCSCASC